jgi:hypothetical protein
MKKVNLQRKRNGRGIPKNALYRLQQQQRYTNIESPSRPFLDPRKFVTLSYCQTFTGTVTTGSGFHQIMRLNSLFDPDLTNATGAHQPYGFDQLAALYARYRVLKTSYKMVFSPAALTYHIAIVPSNGNLPVTVSDQATFQLAAEAPRAWSWAQGASGQSKEHVKTIALNDLNGTSVQEYLTSDRTQALTNTNCTEVLELNLCIFNPNGASITFNLIMTMDFHAEIWDPIVQAQS